MIRQHRRRRLRCREQGAERQGLFVGLVTQSMSSDQDDALLQTTMSAWRFTLLRGLLQHKPWARPRRRARSTPDDDEDDEDDGHAAFYDADHEHQPA